MATVLIIF